MYLSKSLYVTIMQMLVYELCTSDDIVNMEYYVEGSGFHRTLTYKIDVRKFANENCYIAVHLQLPSSLYVNIDELADIRRTKNNLICSEGEVDIELFAEKALPQNISTCSDISNVSSTLSLFIPIHQRYQYVREDGGFVNVILPEPKVLLGCKDIIKQYKVSDIHLCSPCVRMVNKWWEISHKMNNGTYIWQVPVGKASDLHFVTFVTLFTTIAGAFFILKTLWQNKILEHQKVK